VEDFDIKDASSMNSSILNFEKEEKLKPSSMNSSIFNFEKEEKLKQKNEDFE